MDTTPIGHISLAAYQAAVSSLSPQPYIADVRALPTEPGHNGTDEIEAVCRYTRLARAALHVLGFRTGRGTVLGSLENATRQTGVRA